MKLFLFPCIITLLLLTPPAAICQSAAEAKNIEKVRTYWDEVWSKGNMQAVANFYHPAAKHGENFTIENFQKGVASQREAFPDFKVTILDIFATGDKVVTEVIYSGTHSGKRMFGQEPLGKRVSAPGIDIFTFKDGKCIHHQHVADHLDVVTGMGIKLTPVKDPKVLQEAVMKAGQDYVALIKKLNAGKSYRELVSSGNMEALDKLLAAEYVYTDAKGIVYNKKEDMDFYKTSTILLTSSELKDQKVRMVDVNTAVETGVIRFVGKIGEKPLDFTKRYTTTWIWRSGRWQVVADHASRVE